MDSALIVAIVVALIVVILVMGVFFYFGTDNKEKVMRQRFEAVRKAERRGNISLDLKLIRDEMYSSVPLLHRLLMQVSWSNKLQDYINQSGVKVRPGKLVLMSAVAALTTLVIFSQWYHMPALALLLGVVAGTLPLAYVSFMRSRRLKKF